MNSEIFSNTSQPARRGVTMKQQFGTYDLVLRSGVDPTTGGVAICGFTTAGMVGVIAASYIIESLNLTQLGTVMDENFPAVALIQNEVPRHRSVYQGDGIGVFTAEIQFDKEQDIAFGSTVLEWFRVGGFNHSSLSMEFSSQRNKFTAKDCLLSEQTKRSQTTEVTRSSGNTTRCCIRDYRLPPQ